MSVLGVTAWSFKPACVVDLRVVRLIYGQFGVWGHDRNDNLTFECRHLHPTREQAIQCLNRLADDWGWPA